ncbi:MAG: DUF4390 domain-containing protein [Sphingomonadaceae bacterium]
MLLTWLRRPGLLCIAALIGLAAPAPAAAQDEGRFEIRNAFVELQDGAWRLNVRLDLALSAAAQQAFDEGVPLVLELEAEASIARRFLPDQTVVSQTREWQLVHDAIADRHVVTDAASGEHTSYATQAEALAVLARIADIRIADTSEIAADVRFDMRVRASVEIGELPAAIKLLLFWKTWSRSTDWYAWSVRP